MDISKPQTPRQRFNFNTPIAHTGRGENTKKRYHDFARQSSDREDVERPPSPRLDTRSSQVGHPSRAINKPTPAPPLELDYDDPKDIDSRKVPPILPSPSSPGRWDSASEDTVSPPPSPTANYRPGSSAWSSSDRYRPNSTRSHLSRYPEHYGEDSRRNAVKYTSYQSRREDRRVGHKERQQRFLRYHPYHPGNRRFPRVGVNSAPRSLSGPRYSDRIHHRTAYEPGVIFSRAHHTQYVQKGNGESPPADIVDKLTDTKDNKFGQILTKFRRMVVLYCNATGCVAAPIYTHNGKGLDDCAKKSEHFSIRDINDPDALRSEGIYGTLWCERVGPSPQLCVAGKSSVFLAAPFTHHFAEPAKIEGRLLEGEFERLKSAFREVQANAWK